MSAFALSCLLTYLLSFLLAFFVIYKNYREKLNRTWFLVSLSVGVWSFGLWGVAVAKNYSQAMFYQYFLDIGAIFIPVFYFNFAIILLKIESAKRKQLFIFYFFSVLLAIVSFFPIFKKGMSSLYDFNYWIDPGAIYPIFPLFFYLLMSYSFYLLVKHYKNFLGKERNQILYISIASVIGFIGGMTDFFPQLMNIYPIGNYFVMLYVIIVTYAILQFNLMNIKIIATQILSIFLVVLSAIDVVKAKDNPQDLLYQLVVFVAVLLFAILLVHFVNKEVKQRQELQLLSIQLEEANEHLKELMKMKSEFLAIASHQLRTPLTAIRGLLSMQADGDFDSYPKDKMKQVHQDMLTSANRLNNIVNDLLDALEVEGGLKLDLKPIQIEPMIEAAINDLKPNYDKKGLYLKFEKPTPPLPKIGGEERYLSQVFMNLIDNAEKYTPTGGVTITTEVKGDNIIIRVKDTGIGIKPEDQKKLFEKFTRAEMGTRTHAGGSGLGLFIVKKIVTEHQGKIKIESTGEEGKGTTFVVTLPVRQNK